MEEDKQTTEVKRTDERLGDTEVKREEVTKQHHTSGVVVAQRVVYYLGGVLITVLVLRLFLQLFGANPASGFVDLIYGLSAPFIVPFFGIFGEPTFGESHLETSTLVAIVIYSLLVVGAAKLISLTRPREEV